MPTFKYVYVPASMDEALEEMTMSYTEDTLVSCCTEHFQEHYRSKSSAMSKEQKQQMLKGIIEQAKASGKEVDESKLDASMISRLTSIQMCEMIPLVTPKPANGFVAVYMYCDDSGSFKGLPLNNRACLLSQACGRPTQVLGDVFITRTCDDGRDKFERYDFTLDEFDPKARWIVDAGKIPPPPPTQQKKPPSEATIAGWKAQLDAWVAGKLKQWDEDEAFRAARKPKNPDRESYEKFLQGKADAQLQAKLK